MQDSLYVALSSQIALEKRLNTIAPTAAPLQRPGHDVSGRSMQTIQRLTF